MNTEGILIDSIDKVTLFWYIVIFIVILFIFSRMSININIIFGFALAYMLIVYLYNDYKRVNNDTVKLLENKKSLLFPKPIESLEHTDIVNFLFSIQDFYIYNPQAYADMIETIDLFFSIYNETYNNHKMAGRNYLLLIEKKRNALNSLQSIINNMPRNSQYDKKLSDAIYVLESMLNKYIDDIKKLYDNELYESGYTTKTVLINKGPYGYNIYDDKLYTYDFY
jgi:hypothetical protein